MDGGNLLGAALYELSNARSPTSATSFAEKASRLSRPINYKNIRPDAERYGREQLAANGPGRNMRIFPDVELAKTPKRDD